MRSPGTPWDSQGSRLIESGNDQRAREASRGGAPELGK